VLPGNESNSSLDSPKARRSSEGLPIPPSLHGVNGEDDEPWANDRWVVQHEAHWQRKQNIESETTAMSCKMWAQMKVIMRNHNRQKQEQEQKWETLTNLEQHQYAVKNAAILKLQSDWQRDFRATQDRFLALTPSFIPDLRYDSNSKQFIILAQWKESGKDSQGSNNLSLVNQQEIALSKEFVTENFKSDVLEYVRKQLSVLVVLSLFQFQALILCC
jgi:hypothetical protein